jgi:hypothetical protein
MSSEGEIMSVECVRKFGTEGLCQWLKTQLDEDEWKDAESVIRQQKIKGKNFLNYSLEQWVKVVGINAGTAESLVQIAQAVSGTDKKTPESKEYNC